MGYAPTDGMPLLANRLASEADQSETGELRPEFNAEVEGDSVGVGADELRADRFLMACSTLRRVSPPISRVWTRRR